MNYLIKKEVFKIKYLLLKINRKIKNLNLSTFEWFVLWFVTAKILYFIAKIIDCKC